MRGLGDPVGQVLQRVLEMVATTQPAVGSDDTLARSVISQGYPDGATGAEAPWRSRNGHITLGCAAVDGARRRR